MAEVVAGIEAAIIAFRTLQSVYQDVRDRYSNSITNRSRVELCDDHIRSMDHRLNHLTQSYSQVAPYLTPAAHHVWQDELADISSCMHQVTADASDLANALPRAPDPRDTDQGTLQFAARKIVCQARAFTSANDVVTRVCDLNTKLAHLKQKTFDCIDRLDTKRIGLASATALHQQSMSNNGTATNSTRASNATTSSSANMNDGSSFFVPCHSATVPPLHPDTVLRFDDPSSCEGRLFSALCSTFPPSMFSQSNHTAAHDTSSNSGSVLVALGVSGMGGVGKSTALIGLAHHATIQALFPDGVYFMILGKDAGEREVVSELATIVSATGGQLQDDCDSSTHIQRAVQATVEWFQGRRVLFVVDDVWAHGTRRPVGYIPELKRLLACDDQCRLVCSTRSHAIAQEAGMPIAFASRDATGVEARTMLLQYADIRYEAIYGGGGGVTSNADNITNTSAPSFPSVNLKSQCSAPHARPVVDDILTKCCGVPLTIGVAGRGVRRYMQSSTRSFSPDYYAALKAYRDDLYRHGYNVSEEALGNYPNFRSAVDVSLDLAQRAFEQRVMASSFSTSKAKKGKKNVSPEPNQNLSHLFRKLCVLGKARRVPLDVLTRLWPGLVKRHCLLLVNQLIDLNLVICAASHQQQKGSTTGHMYGLHDLVHDYCESCAKDEGLYEIYHAEFLDSFDPKPANQPQYHAVDARKQADEQHNTGEYNHEYEYDTNPGYSYDEGIFNIAQGDTDDDGHVVEEDFPEFTVREKVDRQAHAWWCQTPSENAKRYLFANLARHLREANRVTELVALLTSLQWVALRARRGHGGIIALTADFDVLISYITELSSSAPTVVSSSISDAVKRVLSDVTMLRNAARAFWPYVSRNPLELRTQAYARLLGVGGWLVTRFLATAPPTQLRPLHRYWPVPSTRDDARMSVHGPVSCVAALWRRQWPDQSTNVDGNDGAHEDNASIPTPNVSVGIGGERAVAAVGRDLVFIDLSSLTSVVSWNAHDWQIDYVGWANRANIVVSASSYDGTIRTWDASTKLLSTFRLKPCLNNHGSHGITAILSLDCDAHASRIVVACTAAPSLRVWLSYKREWATWPDMLFPESIAYPVLCAAISDDGARIAIGSADGFVRLLHSGTGVLISGISNMNCPSPISHPGPVTHVTLLADGRRGISASDDHVRVWNLDECPAPSSSSSSYHDHQHQQHLVVTLPHVHKSTVRSVSLSADGRHAAVAWHDGCVRVHRIDPDAAEVREACGTLRHERGVKALISPDGCAVISVAEKDRTIRVWNAGPDRHAGLPRTAHNRIVRVVDIGDGGFVAVSACREGKVRLWDLGRYWATREQEQRQREYVNNYQYDEYEEDDMGKPIELLDCAVTVPINERKPAAECPTGRTSGRKSISVGITGLETHADKTSQHQRKVHGGSTGRVSAVAVNKDGSRVIVARPGDDVRVLDCSSLLEGVGYGGKSSNRARTSKDRGGRHERKGSINNQISYYCSSNVLNSRHIRRSIDNTFPSHSGNDNSSSSLSSMSTMSSQSSLPSGSLNGFPLLRRNASSLDKVLCVATCATGRTIVCGGADGSARVWRGRSCVSEVRKNGGGVMAVDVNMNGRFVGCAARDGRVRLWDDHANIETVVEGHSGVATSVSVSGDGRRVVSGGYDCTVRVYDIGRYDDHDMAVSSNSNVRECVLRGHEAVVRAVALSECGKVIVCGGMDCKLRVWTCASGGGGSGGRKFPSGSGSGGGKSSGKWDFQSYSVAAEVFSVAVARCERLGSLLVMCGLANGQVLFHELRL